MVWMGVLLLWWCGLADFDHVWVRWVVQMIAVSRWAVYVLAGLLPPPPLPQTQTVAVVGVAGPRRCYRRL